MTEQTHPSILIRGLKQSVQRLKQPRKQAQKPEQHFAALYTCISTLDRLADAVSTPKEQQEPLDTQTASALITEALYLQKDNPLMSGSGERWISQYRRIWRQEIPMLTFCFISFLVSVCIGWTIAISHTDLVPVILSQQLVEHILEHQKWFDGIKQNPAKVGFEIAYNNISVSINCMLASALLGIGGMFFLMFNGLFFGAVLGFCYINDFHTPLLEFVISHGPLELSIIIASAFNGMLFGRSFYMRPFSMFTVRLREGARRALLLIRGVLPWLVIAAAFEVFVSPWGYLSMQQKGIAGALLALIFWSWNFYPPDVRLPDDAFADKSSEQPSSNNLQ